MAKAEHSARVLSQLRKDRDQLLYALGALGDPGTRMLIHRAAGLAQMIVELLENHTCDTVELVSNDKPIQIIDDCHGCPIDRAAKALGIEE